MTFVEYAQAGTGTHTISGLVNGTNTIYTLPVAPTRLQLYLNGVQQTVEDLGLVIWDFAWTPSLLGTQTATLTFNGSSTPQTGDILTAWVYIAQP